MVMRLTSALCRPMSGAPACRPGASIWFTRGWYARRRAWRHCSGKCSGWFGQAGGCCWRSRGWSPGRFARRLPGTTGWRAGRAGTSFAGGAHAVRGWRRGSSKPGSDRWAVGGSGSACRVATPTPRCRSSRWRGPGRLCSMPGLGPLNSAASRRTSSGPLSIPWFDTGHSRSGWRGGGSAGAPSSGGWPRRPRPGSDPSPAPPGCDRS